MIDEGADARMAVLSVLAGAGCDGIALPAVTEYVSWMCHVCDVDAEDTYTVAPFYAAIEDAERFNQTANAVYLLANSPSAQ